MSRLGAGGAGEVWRAVLSGPHGFRRQVALKLLRPDRERSDARGLLIAEARLGAFLSHPNVVATYELDEVDGVLLIAMELVHGPSLDELMPGEVLPARVVVDVGIQVCAGLSHVHTLVVDDANVGLVHRDIKPSNLIADRSGLVKIADLGIARLAGDRASRVWGTWGYMPLEQARGREDARADLFALGVTLHVLTLGTMPFGRGREALAAVAKADEQVLRPAFAADIDAFVPGLGAVIARCLRTDPADRWPDATALANALRALVPHLPAGPPIADLVIRDRAESGPSPAAELDETVRGPPRPAGPFVGRSREVAAVMEHVRRGTPWLSVTGAGGVGKTRVVLEGTRAAERELSGGVVWIDLHDARSVDDLQRTVARSLQVTLDPEDPTAQLGRAIGALGSAVVVLDNADAVVGDLAAAASAWMAGAPKVRFVSTCREPDRVREHERLVIEPLQLDDARALFLARSGHAEPAVDEIVARLDGLPLAIELAAAACSGAGPADLVLQLDDARVRLSLTDDARPMRHRSLAASIAASWARLDPEDADALARLSVFENAFLLEHAEQVAGASVQVLERLTERWLVQFDAELGRFRLGSHVRAFAAEQLEEDERWVAEVRHGRIFGWYGTDEALEALYRHGGWKRSLELARSIDDVTVASGRAARRSDGNTAANTALAAAAILVPAGASAAAAQLLEVAYGVARDRDRVRVGRELGHLRLVLGRVAEGEALLIDAQAGAAALGDEPLVGWTLAGRGRVAHQTGRTEAAEGTYRSAIGILNRAGALREEGFVLGILGTLLHQLGRLDEAEAIYRDALRIHREVGDRRSEATRLANLGAVLTHRRQNDEAEGLYRDSLVILRAFGDRGREAGVLVNLGVVATNRGELRSARAWLEEALGFQRAAGALRGAAVSCVNLGVGAFDLGELDLAERWFEEARSNARQISDPRMEGRALVQLGWLHRFQGHAERAETEVRAGLGLVRRAGDRWAEILARCQLAASARERGDFAEATEQLEAAGLLEGAMGDDMGLTGLMLAEHARLALALGDPPSAARWIEDAVARLVSAGDPIETARITMVRADVARAMGGDPEPHVAEVRAIAGRCGLGPDSPTRRWLGA